jgi:ADP-ribosylglycohydrolase
MKIKNALLGAIIGDAVGVPYEFYSRAMISEKPCTDMIGYGTYNQPVGTWSDDSSMILCTLEMLLASEEIDYMLLCKYFHMFKKEGFCTPFNECFDIGHATSSAIYNYELYKDTKEPWEFGGTSIMDNGNGSLMRIIAILPLLINKTFEERFEIIFKTSSLTHGHPISVMSCFIFMEYVLRLYKGIDKFEAYLEIQEKFLHDSNFNKKFPDLFDRILKNNINELPINEIYSDGYVLHTLEASFYCFLTSNSYSECVLKAVNMGSDTDTTACVTGSLSGLYYGIDRVDWIEKLQRKDYLIDVIDKIGDKFKK